MENKTFIGCKSNFKLLCAGKNHYMQVVVKHLAQAQTLNLIGFLRFDNVACTPLKLSISAQVRISIDIPASINSITFCI